MKFQDKGHLYYILRRGDIYLFVGDGKEMQVFLHKKKISLTSEYNIYPTIELKTLNDLIENQHRLSHDYYNDYNNKNKFNYHIFRFIARKLNATHLTNGQIRKFIDMTPFQRTTFIAANLK